MQHRFANPVLGMLVIAGVFVALAAGVIAVLRIDLFGQRGSGLSSRFGYDLEEFQKTDPALIGYKETGQIAVKMEHPRAVAVGPEDNIYVAGDQAVHVLTSAGQPVREIALSDEPQAVGVGGSHHKTPGRIYVALRSRVEVYSPDGAKEASWADAGGKALFTSVAAGESDVYVGNMGQRIVLRYDMDGKLLGQIGARDDARHIPGFVIPSPYFDVAMAPDGLLRVTNTGRHHVEAYTPDGDLEQDWGQPSIGIKGFCGCCNPVNIAVLPDGKIVTAEKGIPRVKLYTSDGEFVCVIAGPEMLLPNRSASEETRTAHRLKVVDVAADGRGRVLVLDPATRNVRVFEATAAKETGAVKNSMPAKEKAPAIEKAPAKQGGAAKASVLVPSPLAGEG